MSHVTDTILLTSCGEESFPANLTAINQWLAEAGPGRYKGLVSVEDPSLPNAWIGGSKALQCEVAIGAFNGLDIPQFLTFLRSLPWEHAQVAMKDEHQYLFVLYQLSTGSELTEINMLRSALEYIANHVNPETEHPSWETAQEALGWPMDDRVRTLDDLVARCKCSVTLTFNGHKDQYVDRTDYIHYELAHRQWGGATDEELITMPAIVELQFYPETPIGFYLVVGPTVEDVVRQAHAILDAS